MMHQIAFGPPLTRAEQRRLQLLEIEMEQRREEQEAMGITEEQRQILLHTFKSVKVEFSDLDGLKWTPAALSTRQRNRPRPKPLPLTTHSSLNLPTKPCPKRKGAHSTAGTSSRTPMVSPYDTPIATPKPSPRSSPYPSPLPSPLPTPTTARPYSSIVHGMSGNGDYPW